jgi:hypothetical protein
MELVCKKLDGQPVVWMRGTKLCIDLSFGCYRDTNLFIELTSRTTQLHYKQCFTTLFTIYETRCLLICKRAHIYLYNPAYRSRRGIDIK